MRAVILCGGRGTRAYPHTVEIPKPLLEVDGVPVLRHVLEIYARQGIADFVLSAGYKAEQIEDFAAGLPDRWSIEVVDTGEDTNTGGRILKCRDLLEGTFLANYADGLGDVDIGALTAFHRSHGGCATLTSVPLPSPYGTIETDGDGRIVEFLEKPSLRDHWINGGYFVFDDRVFDLWQGEDLEREVLPALVDAGELYTYRHDGFWRSMDTYKDALSLTELARTSEGPPWLR